MSTSASAAGDRREPQPEATGERPAAGRRTLAGLLVLGAAGVAVYAARRLSLWRDREREQQLRSNHTLTGVVQLHEWPSEVLGETRRVWVYLPSQFDSQPQRRFPVLYLQDGQNVFDGATAFVAGREWEVDEAAERLIRRGLIEPLIVVALENGGERRADEYTSVRDASAGAGGGLERYGRALVDELKPWVDAHFRTRPEREATAIAGSSLGALAALELALRRPEVFGRVAALSVSAWWGEQAIVRSVESLPVRPDTRVWLDIGTREPSEAVQDARRLRDALVRKGWREGEDLRYLEVPGGTHDEAAWAKRMPEVLEFLYPPRPGTNAGSPPADGGDAPRPPAASSAS